MEFIQASQLPFDPRPQMSRIFVEGFYLWINHFQKDKERLAEAFTHTFLLEHFWIAAEGDVVAAMAACTNGYAPVRLNQEIFMEKLGTVRGFLTYRRLKRNMTRHGYPFLLTPTTGSIEYVATAPRFQRQGLGEGLIKHVMESNNYEAFVLEVADTNNTARRLYERLGFKEFARRRALDRRRTGVNYFLYMRRS